MFKNSPALLLSFALVAPGVLSAAPAPWPVPKELMAKLAAAPGEPELAELGALSDAAFGKKNYADSMTLLQLRKWVAFTRENPLPEELRSWFFANREVTLAIAGLLSEKDDPKAVARILAEIWTKDRDGFSRFPKLACAIALVYDRPSPARFPHSQVSPAKLPRKLHDPAEVFAFFKESADGGRLILSPAKLDIDELAFVVPVIAPLSELREAQRRKINRSDIPKLYPSIVYDHPRLKRGDTAEWPFASYSLATIREKGGICIDQAYYTTTVAQAFGVPAFILCGAGNSGFHAFTGYLERPGKWRVDVGRYANQKYATGTSFNPLTWGELTDHDLLLLESRFRNAPTYAATELMVLHARRAIEAKDLVKAANLLAGAKSTEPRCPEVWSTLSDLADARGDAPAQRQSLYSEAARALGKFRELEIRWRSRLAQSLEDSGKADAALAERIAIVRRNASARPEDAAVLAAGIMADAVKANDRAKTVSLFNKLSDQFEDAGPEFFLKVVYPTVNRLLTDGMKKEASQVVRTTRQKFKGDADSHLGEMQADLDACIVAGSMKGSAFMKYVR